MGELYEIFDDLVDKYIKYTKNYILMGGCIGVLYGAYGGYNTGNNMAIGDHIVHTIICSIIGGFAGITHGLFWPITIGVLVMRQFTAVAHDSSI